MESAALRARREPLSVMVQTVVDAFVKAKVERVEEARALYAVASELACMELVAGAGAKVSAALVAMLSTAPDAKFKDLAVTAYMFATAMIGPMKGVLEGPAPLKLMRALRTQLTSLCLGYLERESRSS